MNTTEQKPKRQQVKNACVNCQKACKKCDDGRPCQRCTKLSITETCRNSERKERKKGIKRGPYKKRTPVSEEVPINTVPESELDSNINYCVPSQLTGAELILLLQNYNFPLDHQCYLSNNDDIAIVLE